MSEPTEEERAAADRLMTAAQNGKISGQDLQMIFDARWVSASFDHARAQRVLRTIAELPGAREQWLGTILHDAVVELAGLVQAADLQG